jgi:hypothetical protein
MSTAEKSLEDIRKEKEQQVESGVKTVYVSSMGFLTSTAKTVFWTTLYFALGAIVLYCSKIGKANILPEENTCIPKIPGNEINVFIEGGNSQKFKFNNSPANTKNFFLDMFRNYSNKKKGKSQFPLYGIALFESLILKNNMILNTVFTFFNDKFSESIIILIGPILLGIIVSFLGIIDCFYFLYIWFTSLSIFFKKEDPVSGDMISLDSNDKTSSYFWALCKAVIVLCFTTIALGLAPGIVSIVLLSCLIGMIGYQGKLRTKVGFDKELSVGSFIIETFKFFKVGIMIILSIIVTINAFDNLGALAGIFAIVVILLIKFDIISIGLFKPIVPDFISKRTDDCDPNVAGQKGVTPACDNLTGNACSGQSGGGKKRKVTQGYLEQFLDDVTGKTHKDLMRQINSLKRLS